MALTVYPTLKGLDFTVIKRPIFGNGVNTAGSGREVRLGYWGVNLWEYELNYSYLPDAVMQGTTNSDLKTLMGFFLSVYGDLNGFAFLDPDDNAVVGQTLATGDGVTTAFTFARQFGLGTSLGPLEPVGEVNLGNAVNIYLNSVLQASGYTVSIVNPAANTVTFSSAPALGVTVSADFSYYFYTRFKDPQYDFTKFVNQIWSLQSVILRSIKAPT